MHWEDEGFVLGARDHGESAVILEVMTRDHGRHLGLVHGGRSRKSRPVLQAGNTLALGWRARTDDGLGHFTAEPSRMRSAGLIGSSLALYGLGTLALHLRHLPERDPHPGLYAAASFLLDNLDEPALAPALFVRFELMLLAELGFGLDLSACAATGLTGDLAYVSPKSGRAVSEEAGAAYADRLLPLPSFLAAGNGVPARPGDLAAGFRLTAFFLDAHVWAPRGLTPPDERARFVHEAGRRERSENAAGL